MKITFRPVQVADIPTLIALANQVYFPHYRHMWYDDGHSYIDRIYAPERLRQELDDLSAHFYFVDLDGLAIGLLRYYDANSQTDVPPHLLYLDKIYLDQSVVGKGVGAVVMQWLRNIAIEQQAKGIFLKAMDTAKAAQRFYEKVGFEVTGVYHLDFEAMKPAYRGMILMEWLI